MISHSLLLISFLIACGETEKDTARFGQYAGTPQTIRGLTDA